MNGGYIGNPKRPPIRFLLFIKQEDIALVFIQYFENVTYVPPQGTQLFADSYKEAVINVPRTMRASIEPAPILTEGDSVNCNPVNHVFKHKY
jgi:hypothetical protein